MRSASSHLKCLGKNIPFTDDLKIHITLLRRNCKLPTIQKHSVRYAPESQLQPKLNSIFFLSQFEATLIPFVEEIIQFEISDSSQVPFTSLSPVSSKLPCAIDFISSFTYTENLSSNLYTFSKTNAIVYCSLSWQPALSHFNPFYTVLPYYFQPWFFSFFSFLKNI